MSRVAAKKEFEGSKRKALSVVTMCFIMRTQEQLLPDLTESDHSVRTILLPAGRWKPDPGEGRPIWQVLPGAVIDSLS